MIRALLEAIGLGGRRAAADGLPVAPQPGDLWSVATGNGEYGVMKLLAVDAGGVHARLYVQRFRGRPTTVDPASLFTASFEPGSQNPFSIGHVPLSYESYHGWQPEFIGRGTVAEEELEGYRMWQDAQAGYF